MTAGPNAGGFTMNADGWSRDNIHMWRSDTSPYCIRLADYALISTPGGRRGAYAGPFPTLEAAQVAYMLAASVTP